MQKWNEQLHAYLPYEPPEGGYYPIYCEDMKTPVNCASCGRPIVFGEGFTSQTIHNSYGIGYSVCRQCNDDYWTLFKENPATRECIYTEEHERVND